MNRLTSIFRQWLSLAALTIVMCSLVYLVGQQILRQSANDPQIQIAEDAAAELSNGADAQALLPSASTDVAHSLAPFLIIYDDSGKVVASSALLDGSTPQLPDGVLDNVRKNGEDRITWQPKAGVRIATVIVPVTGSTAGFVLAGRSLREVEIREDNIGKLTLLALAVILVGMFFVVAIVQSLLPDKK
ncbi:MAG TPA: hypothetical protein VMC62_12455 [Longilinea sp.]|nr:hypothetical protein [Longilinea sp.]